ncbi:hypothetical protein [Crenobacter cavernae]|uniref:hypothetical protein n=1 Tax=Crenobacter cavernae TaxID=2290923 RepID=UPI00100F789C|nr:hypothetical protein [Crenobacter cavernae]
MQRDELIAIIQTAGGKCGPLGYADALLEKINRLEAAGGYEALFAQLRPAKEQGDLRGRVLEVNFANLFVERGAQLKYGARQGMPGDVDFCWGVNGYQVFIEMKLLGQDRQTKEDIRQQLANPGCKTYGAIIPDDTFDLARIQRDIFAKSSTKKFNPKPNQDWVNLVAIDVSELQLGTVDVADCILAAAGNEIASRYCHFTYLRPTVVGVFERDGKSISAEQTAWVKCFHNALTAGEPHPRDYIHGVLFLFRDPAEQAALSYRLIAAMVWNPALIDDARAKTILEPLHKIVDPLTC